MYGVHSEMQKRPPVVTGTGASGAKLVKLGQPFRLSCHYHTPLQHADAMIATSNSLPMQHHKQLVQLVAGESHRSLCVGTSHVELSNVSCALFQGQPMQPDPLFPAKSAAT